MKQQDSLKEVLKHMSVCPVCGGNYGKNRARLFAAKANANLAHISCEKCKSNFIAMILFMHNGISSVGMVSDLTLADAEKIHCGKKIDIDEVLDHHLLINLESTKILNILNK